ncbi:iron ABC transporter ATP-binding protein [Luteococcus sp. Sow4_B9]|uniref:iron ABC transporter ATP-binding protein n=1 Tax=Luteococcus sp. Sow4_B9 TaxID=3438792 RepID=UPI003F99A158
MIITDHLQAKYGETVVVDDVTIEIPARGVTALVGPNGAGKSTLLAMISRLLEPAYGRVLVDDLDIQKTPSDQLARKLAILRQDNHLAVRLTVRDLVAFGRYPHSKGRLTIEDEAHIEQAMEYLDLAPFADRFLDQLSGGQRQRAFVAMVLAQDTDHILLDEPLNNLDMSHGVRMMRQMRRAADELGKSIVIVLHDLNAASLYADHIVVMADGQVVAAGSPEEIMQEELLSEVFGLPIRVREIDGERVALHYAR